MHCSLFQGTHIGGLWSEEIVFVETFAQSYKSISRVAGMSLTLVWSALKLFCKLRRLCGTFEGRSTYKDSSLDLGLMDTPLPISSSFHGILQLPSSTGGRTNFRSRQPGCSSCVLDLNASPMPKGSTSLPLCPQNHWPLERLNSCLNTK